MASFTPIGRVLILTTLASWSVQAHSLQESEGSGGRVASHDAAAQSPFPGGEKAVPGGQPAPAAVFAPFAPVVRVRWDERYFYVESDAMPSHPMMVGITAWQQQVPIPQAYAGRNAWRFPLEPVPAKQPLSARDHFFRGAIAIAANGVPIFNPIKNDGRTDTFLAGELDQFGGHTGRADDYHYHVAPLHLQAAVGPGRPVAYALDGYAIYGLACADGAPPADLDKLNGHTTAALGYHYHATKTYPYLNGGFHGEVTEREGQVDPQPQARGVRPATSPLRGAVITGFERPAPGAYAVAYRVSGEQRAVNYQQLPDGSIRFDYVDGQGRVQSETYVPTRRPAAVKAPGGNRVEKSAPPARQPWLKVHAREMDANKDGTLTRAELDAELNMVFAGYDHNHDGQLTAEEYGGPPVRSAMGGFVGQHAKEIDADADGRITLAELTATAGRMFEKADGNRNGQLDPGELALPAGYQATPPDGSRPHPPR